MTMWVLVNRRISAASAAICGDGRSADVVGYDQKSGHIDVYRMAVLVVVRLAHERPRASSEVASISKSRSGWNGC